MRRIKREIVGAVLVSTDNKVLLGRTAADAGGVYSGNWVIPGGGIDRGETPEQALIREVLEETHHDISRCQLELVSDSVRGESQKRLKQTGELVVVEMTFRDYLVRLAETADQLGDKPSQELVELRWFGRDGLNRAPLSSPTDGILRKLDLKD